MEKKRRRRRRRGEGRMRRVTQARLVKVKARRTDMFEQERMREKKRRGIGKNER